MLILDNLFMRKWASRTDASAVINWGLKVAVQRLLFAHCSRQISYFVARFHLHLCKCLNVSATYAFLPTPHCRRTYADFSFYFKGTDKKQWKGYQMKVLGTYRLKCVIQTVTDFNRYLQYVCMSKNIKVSTAIWCYAIPDPTSRLHRGVPSSLLHSS
jgi:hypothetical protein